MVKMESTVSIIFKSCSEVNIDDFHVVSGEISYQECTTFSDMSGPAMINTFNDINKLVQARKL